MRTSATFSRLTKLAQRNYGCGTLRQFDTSKLDLSKVRAEVTKWDSTKPIESAVTPPSSWYTCPDIAELEKRYIFHNSWICVGSHQQISDKGKYISGEVAGEPYVIVKGNDGVNRGFFNVCRHHAARVVSKECGEAEKLICPYHGWQYTLEGKLHKTRRMQGVKDFTAQSNGLVPLHGIESFGPLMMLKFRGDLPHEPKRLNDLAQINSLNKILSDDWKWNELKYVTRRTYTLECNWKVFVDNYCDGGYHVDHLHIGLAAQLNLNDYRSEIHDFYSLQMVRSYADRKGDATDSKNDHLDFSSRLEGGAIYSFVYPNLMINRYGPWLDVDVVYPLGPNKCLVVMDYFATPEVVADEWMVNRSLAASHQVQLEDIGVCEDVQRNLHSMAFDGGRYAPQVESPALHFHSLLHKDLLSATRL